MATRLNPFGPEYLDDPYRVFKDARADARAYYSEDLGYWILTRYEDIRQVIRDTVNFSADAANTPLQPFGKPVLEELAKADFRPVRVLVDNDPPGHVRVRRQVNKAFNAQRVKLMEEPVRELTRRHIDRFAGQQEVEFVSALAWPLPALVLFHLFGMPDSYLEVVKNGSADRVILTTGRPDEQEALRAAKGLADFYALCRQLIDDRLENPRDDFPSDLIRAGEGQEEPLTTRELVQVMYSMLFAGHETTTGHLTHLVRRVLLEPGLWQRLREDRSLIPNVVEEVLRLEAPVINWRRRAKHDVEVGGVTIPADAKILLLLGSANHDEEFFEDADALQPERRNARHHLTFGFGEHLCLGAPLARLEGRVVLEELVDRFASPSLPEQELEFTPSILFRSPKALTITL
ncbi:cytochrome P450 [Acrocarpospora catenulata]|uniref:cytochrome P450 n=1 Tax=Acrocarpospora catenulata TaxID=2836182 RepID=UPI001BDA09B0|nr:cytochrome P450 [Acrocarpospora catenulata]